MSEDDLRAQFDEAMHEIYRRAYREANYNASLFLQMLHTKGGLETAKYLINKSEPSDGYTALWERKRLDLTVEAMVLADSRWHALFLQEELARCRKRLGDYGYKF